MRTLLFCVTFAAFTAAQVRAAQMYSRNVVHFDNSGLRSGPVALVADSQSVTVKWADEVRRRWVAVFSLNPGRPLIKEISVDGAAVLHNARPYYECNTGKRHGGWNAFFDFPPANPAGVHLYRGEFALQSASATTVGNRPNMTFNGLRMGLFSGSIRYVIFPGSRLIQQIAVVSTT